MTNNNPEGIYAMVLVWVSADPRLQPMVTKTEGRSPEGWVALGVYVNRVSSLTGISASPPIMTSVWH